MKKLIIIFLIIFGQLTLYAQEEFKFAIITDTHLSGDSEEQIEDLKQAITEINHNAEISFVLVLGDISEAGDRYTLQLAKDLFDHLEIPYYAVSGNHEPKWSESGATDFANIFGSENFEFEFNGVRFLGFNTGPIIRMMDGHVGPQDIKWLKERLSAHPKQPTIIATHYPMQDGDVDNWYEVTDAVRSYNVRTFLGGHYHSNRHLAYDGIPRFLSRSLRRAGEARKSGYSVVEYRTDSLVIFEKNLGEQTRKWGAISLTDKHYTADNSGCPRSNFSVNDEYAQWYHLCPRWKIGEAFVKTQAR